MLDLRGNYRISRDTASSGMVLLKNEGDLLPFTPTDRVGVVGMGALDLIKGGGGSASVMCEYVKTLFDGFTEKRSEGKLNFDEQSFDLSKKPRML